MRDPAPLSLARFTAAGVALLLVAGAELSADETLPSFTLLLTDQATLSDKTVTAVQVEAEELFTALGTRVEWYSEPVKDPAGVPTHVVEVVLMSRRPESWGLHENSMGAALVSRLRPSGVVAVVFVEKVGNLATIPHPSGFKYTPKRGSRLVQALARVMVHEIIHILAPLHGHSEIGIMEAAHSSDSLTAFDIALDSKCANSFRTGVLELQRFGRPSIRVAAVEGSLSDRMRAPLSDEALSAWLNIQ